MPRKPRSETRHAIFHVMAQGVNKEDIFRGDSDYFRFLRLLAQSRDKDPHFLLAFCLMPNHIHLLLETTEVPLPRIMQRLLQRYSQYFNRKYNRVGYLFRNRYFSKACRRETYLLRLLAYIHDNPREAGLVADGPPYPFSSESVYEFPDSRSLVIVDTDRALGHIGPSVGTARASYLSYLAFVRQPGLEPTLINEGKSESPAGFCPEGSVYMDKDSGTVPESGEGTFEFLRTVPLGQICEGVAHIMGITTERILGKDRCSAASNARSILIGISLAAGWRFKDLKEAFGFYPGTIAYQADRYNKMFSPEKKKRLFSRMQEWILRKDIPPGKADPFRESDQSEY